MGMEPRRNLPQIVVLITAIHACLSTPVATMRWWAEWNLQRATEDAEVPVELERQGLGALQALQLHRDS
jgi:hypothetical protein